MPVQGIPNSVDWIEFLKLRRDKATDPEDIAKLDNFIEHLAAEFSHDWDTTMDTMAPDGVSRTWGGGPFMEMLGDELDNDGRRAFYEGMTEAGGDTAFKFVAMDTERCFVGEDGIALDGTLWNVVTGEQLAGWGAEVPEGADPAGTFAVGRRLALFMSYRNGKMVGEDTYWHANCEVRVIDEKVDIPNLPEWFLADRAAR